MVLIVHGSPIAAGLTNSSEALQEYYDREEEKRRARFKEGLAARQVAVEEQRAAALTREQEQRGEILKQQAAQLAEQRAARKEASDLELFGFKQQFAQPGIQGPAALNLPPELWEDYHATLAALEKSQDPAVRRTIAEDARARWTQYTVEKKRNEVAARVDATLQGLQAESDPNRQGPQEPGAQRFEAERQKLEQLRDLVSSGKADPIQAEQAILDYQHGIAQEQALAESKRQVVDFIAQELPNVRSLKDRRMLNQIAAGVRSGLIQDPEKAYRDAVTAIHGFSDSDLMQGSGRPYSEAPVAVRAQITQQARKNALDYLKADPAFQKDAGGTSEQFRSRYEELVAEETQNLARANGWSEDLPTPWGMTPGAPGPAIPWEQMTPNPPEEPARQVDTTVLEGVPQDVQEAAKQAIREGDVARARAILKAKKAPAKAGPLETNIPEKPGDLMHGFRAKSGGPF